MTPKTHPPPDPEKTRSGSFPSIRPPLGWESGSSAGDEGRGSVLGMRYSACPLAGRGLGAGTRGQQRQRDARRRGFVVWGFFLSHLQTVFLPTVDARLGF